MCSSPSTRLEEEEEEEEEEEGVEVPVKEKRIVDILQQLSPRHTGLLALTVISVLTLLLAFLLGQYAA